MSNVVKVQLTSGTSVEVLADWWEIKEGAIAFLQDEQVRMVFMQDSVMYFVVN